MEKNNYELENMNDQPMSEDYYLEANNHKILCDFLNEDCIDHIFNYINPKTAISFVYKEGYIDCILLNGDNIWKTN